MKSLAALLLDLGWSISGSDLNPSESCLEWLRTRGIAAHTGHAAENVPRGTELLIYSAAVRAENPERMAARGRSIPERSYSQMLGELMRQRQGVGIAGTHGKSTTAAMTATVLRAAGREPSVCVGAELCGLGVGGWAGTGDLFVAECCEFRRSFLDLNPTYAAILNIEADHFDCFQNLGETREAFRQFASRVPREGLLAVRQLSRGPGSGTRVGPRASRRRKSKPSRSLRRPPGSPKTCDRLPRELPSTRRSRQVFGLALGVPDDTTCSTRWRHCALPGDRRAQPGFRRAWPSSGELPPLERRARPAV